ncbi:DUF1932 domain-containing protein [Sphingosinicella sp. LHD-64]|uniref:NAD(P)-dependent oxidoreductase n=1 Tax=Sphingosinicella sp. LHD-64 TaxID=3072139 RepID=UPI00280EDED8|nr:DUF1932 domain-containing protein [Sphingosinicella sp. LHD-64]MDQ8757421.1 DUF1932 domain-containing protein [Sphingosinicella sp. LHD-64]
MREFALIGFGEAGKSFASAGCWGGQARVFDTQDRAADYAEVGVSGCASNADAVCEVAYIQSLVTADQALTAAQTSAASIAPGTFYFDMNSVAPDTKRAAAEAIEAAGGYYFDVAIMAPVNPARLAVPLLLSGGRAEAGVSSLAELGFSNVRAVGNAVGQASAIKMIRSVMVKGIEALTAEMMLGADAAGVTDDVLASLGEGWAAKAEYDLERMRSHGRRRAAEMEEVARTLSALGVEPLMTRSTILRQRGIAA